MRGREESSVSRQSFCDVTGRQASLACLAQRKRQAAAAPVGAPSRIASEASDARKVTLRINPCADSHAFCMGLSMAPHLPLHIYTALRHRHYPPTQHFNAA
ncbi:hypothetical protein HaLaN_10706 [Haematococcus lacustris]|uniref:Uncharacterized protein n=1 Tax=Haematococcus lacustris TaxID=44745 RepID=A0A699YZG0_HAELA|nr:hypothetical protein HaLaN_10706 [Haematococcus lacustris]